MLGGKNAPESNQHASIGFWANIISFIRTYYIKLARIVLPQHKKTSNISNLDVSVGDSTELVEMENFEKTCEKLERMCVTLTKENRDLKEENKETKLSVTALQDQVDFLIEGLKGEKLKVNKLQNELKLIIQKLQKLQKPQDYKKKRPNRKTYKGSKLPGWHREECLPPHGSFFYLEENSFRNEYQPTQVNPFKRNGLPQRSTFCSEGR